jgi:hypothetical protein
MPHDGSDVHDRSRVLQFTRDESEKEAAISTKAFDMRA